MNPPEVYHPKQKKFCLTFEVTEGKTAGSIISFDHVSSSIISSLSSGALADHSSLSESSESLHHLPVHSSTSTNSSGLSAPRTVKRQLRPCQCCSVLNYLKLQCVCGHGNLLFVRDVSSKDGVDAKEGARHPEVCSDMDLTDPVISERTQLSADGVTPTEAQQSQPFPRIRLSIRPECIIPMAAENQEEEFEEIPNWWRFPNWEQLMAFPDELPVYSRPLMVPSHYKEDKRSRFLTLLWICRTLYAYNIGSEPPQGLTRVFYDPRIEPELPNEIYNLLDKFSDNDIVQILKRFEEVRHLTKKASGGEFQGDDVQSTTADEPIGIQCSPDDAPNTDQYFVEEFYPIYGYDYEYILPEIDDGTRTQDRSAGKFVGVEVNEGFIADQSGEIGEGAHAQDTTAADGGGGKDTLVYARYQTWYYPGVIECSVEEWDNATQPITVKFYDGSPSKELAPDMIFPLQRLPPGANFQLQLENSVYDDVFFMSFTPSLSDSGMPSATVQILSEDTPMTSVPFSMTALSPKDVVQIRSALKSSFYPTMTRRNFTELSAGAILDYPSRRARAAVPADDRTKKVQLVPSKRKKDVSEKPSSSSETTPSSPKRPKLPEVTSTPLSEPSSSTERLHTSSEESADKAYLCTAPGCGKLFDSERQLLEHREKIKRNRKRRHTTMEVVSRSQHKPLTSPREAVEKVKNIAGTSRSGGSRCVTVPLPGAQKSPISDSETDTSSSLCTSRWSRSVQGFGLRPEKCQLSDEVKSFKKIKGESKTRCPPQTDLFSFQHFILTNGPPQTFKKSRKRAVDSESDSTDVENYYSTSLKFEVLKLQEAIECGGGHLYTDFLDVPADLRKYPGHDLIVISSHPTCTANYIYGVALGCTIIRHDTIFDCIQKRVSLRDALSSGSAILLPPGWCENKMTWAPPRASRVKPLRNLMFFVALRSNLESKSFWSSLIRHLGGKPIVIEENHQMFARLDSTINFIVADPEVATRLAAQAYELGVPIVNTAWVIQAVITGSQPPFSSYQVTIVDSSS